MLDKKINETIDILIKIKDNNLGSIKLSNKVNILKYRTLQ